ncbi:class I SAM-dependent methyltransferase [Gimesia fumaroli]|uniref:Demethylrebeccamycin-D-glucose O-methyltransferase n=1 Tax=Gimesia fumaroli TaxID=2527976 RepID=A0A518IL20_9PLAN|nr:class I SAM-dependent methyltransferase [Gimesia fumaroli]QDV53792.1 Demethylrebeccamycin-D-glucose O-methyltransferase [Gimesia fumaroli]
MIPRQLEPEVMDTREEAVDYNSMDHSDVNRLFADDVLELIAAQQANGGSDPDSKDMTILDLGTGTALIPIELCKRNERLKIVATDLATEMLRVAEVNLQQAQLRHLVTLERADAKQLPCADHCFDGVISNSLIHHVPEPESAFHEIVRVIKPGGFLLVRDLLRPDSSAELERLVELYAGEANPHQRQMFHDSLHAALTLEEVQVLLTASGLPPSTAQITSDRHWTIAAMLPEE